MSVHKIYKTRDSFFEFQPTKLLTRDILINEYPEVANNVNQFQLNDIIEDSEELFCVVNEPADKPILNSIYQIISDRRKSTGDKRAVVGFFTVSCNHPTRGMIKREFEKILFEKSRRIGKDSDGEIMISGDKYDSFDIPDAVYIDAEAHLWTEMKSYYNRLSGQYEFK